MARKLFVGNLAYRVTDEDLQQLFSQSGTVESARVISDRETGKSKGFGFVEMTTDSEAESAIQKLNGFDLLGRKISVNEARAPEERKPRFDRGAGGGGGGGRGGFGGGGGNFRPRREY